MNGPDRETRALSQLLRAAKARADDVQAHLADLEAARQSAEASLDWLAQAVRAEETARGGDAAAIHDFARFLEGAEAKRAALTATRDRLAAEISQIQELLSDAICEHRKLDHLVEARRRASKRLMEKVENAKNDELSVLRQRG